MVTLSVIFLLMAVAAAVASQMFGFAARGLADVADDDTTTTVPFSALVGWAAFFQAVSLSDAVASLAFFLAHVEGWR